MSQLASGPRISPFLWYDTQAEEAAKFYVSIFPNSRIVTTLAAPPGSPSPVLTVAFELDGQAFVALNGGPVYKFNEAVSFFIRCADQAEVDFYWEKLQAGGGNEIQCGWLRDRFGLCWQVVPEQLTELIRKPKAFQAMLKMKKIDLAELQRAAQEAP